MTLRFFSTSALVLLLTIPARADFNYSTFEDAGLTKANSYFNATPNLTSPTASSSGQFASGGNMFANSYTYYSAYGVGSWQGFSISNQTNTSYINQVSTPDSSFQYTSVTGSGAPDPVTGKASATYAVANTEGNGTKPVSVINLAAGSSPVSLQYTNTAYDYETILHGDSFATAFTKGNYLTLSISGYTGLDGGGTMINGAPILIYLADYRELNMAPDTIVTTWQTQNLSGLANARSLVFGVDSNDFNAYGEALAYEFALDNLQTITPGVVPEPSSWLLCLSGIGIVSLVHRRARSRKGPSSEVKRELR